MANAFSNGLLRRREMLKQGGDSTAADRMLADLATEIARIQDRISERLGKKGALEAMIKALERRSADIEAELATRRQELAECEKQCADRTGPPAIDRSGSQTAQVQPPANLAVAKSQPERCKLGQACTFHLGVTNEGRAPYSGPIFLIDRMRSPVRLGRMKQGDWFCSGGATGEILCHANVTDLAPGAEAGIRLSVGLARGLPRDARENCGSVIQPRAGATGAEARNTVRLIQLGLNRLGIDAGPVDGQAGRRTSQAIAAFLAQKRQEANAADATMDVIASALFGDQVFNQVLGTREAGEKCIPIDVEEPPRTRQPPIRRRPPPDRYVPETRAPGIPFEFGIGIGVGGGGGDRHDRQDGNEGHKRRDRNKLFDGGPVFRLGD